MNVEIGTEAGGGAAQFPEKNSYMGFLLQCRKDKSFLSLDKLFNGMVLKYSFLLYSNIVGVRI
jgi:hypothetical protein